MRLLLALSAAVLTVSIFSGCGRKPAQAAPPGIGTSSGATVTAGRAASTTTSAGGGLQYDEKKNCKNGICK